MASEIGSNAKAKVEVEGVKGTESFTDDAVPNGDLTS